MALLDITNPDKKSVVYFNRGNVGVLLDIVSRYLDSLRIPTPSGGGVADVFFIISAT